MTILWETLMSETLPLPTQLGHSTENVLPDADKNDQSLCHTNLTLLWNLRVFLFLITLHCNWHIE